jgi:hypothetical protein
MAKRKREEDVNEAAFRVVRESTSEPTKKSKPRPKRIKKSK